MTLEEIIFYPWIENMKNGKLPFENGSILMKLGAVICVLCAGYIRAETYALLTFSEYFATAISTPTRGVMLIDRAITSRSEECVLISVVSMEISFIIC